jgi:predicted HD phosphohydrolase
MNAVMGKVDFIQRASFAEMAKATEADWSIVASRARQGPAHLVAHIIGHLRILDEDPSGYAIDRLKHSLQCATRAHRAGEDEQFVVCALLHDIGDTLCPANHADMAAAIVRPYVGEKNHWIVEKHGIFQGYYFFQHFGLDRNMREQYRGHPFFEECARFCHIYDQNSFDPNFDSMPLDAFVPLMNRVFGSPKQST